MEAGRKKGHFTFRTAAVLLMVSGVLELLSVTSEVPLFGEIRGGVSGGIYHLVYAVLFLVLGAGMWSARKWSETLLYVTTVIYTLDMLQFLSSQRMREMVSAQLQSALEVIMPGISQDLTTVALILLITLFVFCWWGFALYTYWRRDYFKSP